MEAFPSLQEVGGETSIVCRHNTRTTSAALSILSTLEKAINGETMKPIYVMVKQYSSDNMNFTIVKQIISISL